MKISAGNLSIYIKILGGVILVTSLILKGIGIFGVEITDVILVVVALQGLVLPIDISKIRCSKDKERNDYHDKQRGGVDV